MKAVQQAAKESLALAEWPGPQVSRLRVSSLRQASLTLAQPAREAQESFAEARLREKTPGLVAEARRDEAALALPLRELPEREWAVQLVSL
jgi:hypothetical protein